jgi:endonuclease/exonuclease/phosphatase family metal-dependent hydrolase
VKVRIATYNIRKGGRRRRHHLAEVVRALDADVTVLQEATDPRVVRSLAEAAECDVVIHAPGRSVAMLSRVPTASPRWHRMARARNFVEVELADARVRVIGVHLSAGLSGRGERRRSKEIEHVIRVAGEPPGKGRTLIVGDLNAIAPGDVHAVVRLPAWIRLLLRVDGGIGTTVMARVLGEGFTDAYRREHPDVVGPTMPAAAPSVRLDYLLLGADLVPAMVACSHGAAEPSLLWAASDHLPVVLDLDLSRVRDPGVPTGSSARA